MEVAGADAAPTARQRLVAEVVAARLSGDDARCVKILEGTAMPPPLRSVASRVAVAVPGFLPRFLLAVDPGADLENAWPRFVVWLMREVCLPAITVDNWGCRAAVEAVAALYEKGPPAYAANAAYAAAYAAYAANAANAAYAAHAAYAAYAYRRMADKLIEIVRTPT